MSAYMVSDCQITALSAYALCHRLAGRLIHSTEKNPLDALGNLLKRENVKSLLARYGSQAGETWTDMGEPFKACFHAKNAPHRVAPMEIIKAARNYAYQACEHDGWRENLVRELVEWIVDHAISDMPEYRAAAWGYECNHGGRRIAL